MAQIYGRVFLALNTSLVLSDELVKKLVADKKIHYFASLLAPKQVQACMDYFLTNEQAITDVRGLKALLEFNQNAEVLQAILPKLTRHNEDIDLDLLSVFTTVISYSSLQEYEFLAKTLSTTPFSQACLFLHEELYMKQELHQMIVVEFEKLGEDDMKHFIMANAGSSFQSGQSFFKTQTKGSSTPQFFLQKLVEADFKSLQRISEQLKTTPNRSYVYGS